MYDMEGAHCLIEPAELPYPRTEYDCETKDIRFLPAVYEQRYLSVYNILNSERWKGKIKKLIDFGCAELGFFTLIKALTQVEEVLMVDADESILKRFGTRAEPLLYDYIHQHEHPFTVQVYQGSVAEPNQCLLNADAVVCIELIEHVYPDVLEEIPYNIFGSIQPSLAIFTTPNVEFNILFSDPHRFRHYDHKFEWTRNQFECWATNIVQRYPNYSVTFEEIGPPPIGYENLGPVTQMAIFTKNMNDDQMQEKNIESFQKVKFDTETINNQTKDFSNLNGDICLQNITESDRFVTDNYKLIYEFNYPIKVDTRTEEEKLSDEIEYVLNKFKNEQNDNYEIFRSQDDEFIQVPIDDILERVRSSTVCSEEELKKYLEKVGYAINENHMVLVDNFTNCKDRNYYLKAFDVDYYYNDDEYEGPSNIQTNVVSQGNGEMTECWD